EGILERASRYRADGADVIDLGCLPGVPFPHLEEAIAALHERDHRVSVDSLVTEELLRGGRAGADHLLSLKESTLAVADEVGSIPVLIPEEPGDLASLCRAIDALSARGRPFIADSVLDPIHFGLSRSLARYVELRDRYPGIEIMMGTGNVSELTDADTAGLNAFMLGVMSELRITHLLTTEVSPHARAVVREIDCGPPPIPLTSIPDSTCCKAMPPMRSTWGWSSGVRRSPGSSASDMYRTSPSNGAVRCVPRWAKTPRARTPTNPRARP
ncbi:MAG: hypothetical protein LC647_12810, partial [Beggiatoa sp.]|nr:hypothetical protein [Beggiatoa sp.]